MVIITRKHELIKIGSGKNFVEFFDCIGAFSMFMRKCMLIDEKTDERTIAQMQQLLDVIDKSVRALARAVLVDVELHQYCRVKVVAALYSASCEIERSKYSKLGPKRNIVIFEECQRLFMMIIDRLFSVEVK